MPARRSVRRYRPGGGGFYRNLARGVGYAWRNRKTIVKAGRSVGKSIKKWARSGASTTAQRDIRTSGPPRSKRVNKRFTRKVEGVISQHAGKNTVIFIAAPNTIISAAGAQAFAWFTLFGSNGSTGQTSDINKMLTLHEDPTDLEDPESKNLFFNYGVVEMAFTNRSTVSRCYVDIYEWKTRRGVDFLSPNAMLSSNIADEDILTDPAGPAGNVNLNEVGVSPYQISEVCKNMKFGKKTTILLGPGGTSNYTMARKKNRWLSGIKVRDHTSFAYDGWTEGLLFLTRGAPENGSIAAAITIDYVNMRKYSWRAMDPTAKNQYMQIAW